MALVFSAAFTAPAHAQTLRIVALGDSLTAGYGLAADEGFTDRLEAALRASGHDVVIVNAGVSGDTATGGAERLDWTLAEGADAVIVELGANDALRGVDPAVTEAALRRILAALAERGTPVLLAGMRAPPNMGADYAARFDALYPRLAAAFDVVFYPFFLDGVAGNPALNQGDAMHPTSEGVDVIVAGILPFAEELVSRIAAR